MIMRDPKDVKPTKIITVTNTCKSPFEYMQQQRLANKFAKNDDKRKNEGPNINDLQKFNREQISNSFKNQFPK